MNRLHNAGSPATAHTVWNAGTNENVSELILHAQEDERKRISRDLHDEVSQALVAVSLSLETLNQSATADTESFKTKVADTRRLVLQTIDTVHRFARELRPAMLDELGLLPTLSTYLKDFANRTGLHVDFHADAGAEDLDGDRKTVVFRIAQESLTNIAKHAQASRVKFSLRKIKDTICVAIADDGKSFNQDSMESARKKKRLGLLGMRERAGLVGGNFTIEARPGQGTTVRVMIPLQAANATVLPKPARKMASVRSSPTLVRSGEQGRITPHSHSLAGYAES